MSRSQEVADCAVLGKIKLTAREVLSHGASDWKANERQKPEQKIERELAIKNGMLKNAVEAAKESTARLQILVQEYEITDGTKQTTVERQSNSGSKSLRYRATA